jgi:hypothetical protein
MIEYEIASRRSDRDAKSYLDRQEKKVKSLEY